MTKLKTKPSAVFAEYLKKPERFADFINLVLFDGSQIIKPDKLRQWDSDSSTIFFDESFVESTERRRDIIMLAEIDGLSVFIAIEHQQRIDYSMCKRVFSYDHATYNQQFNLCDAKKRQYLHPIPVVTIVIYTGEVYWSGPRTFKDRMHIPEIINDKINDWNGNIIDMKDMDATKLRCIDNQKVVSAVQRFYAWDKDIDSIADISLSKEIAIVVLTIIRVKELIGYIEKEDGKEEISMCTAIRDFREDGKRLGISIGEEHGMAKTLIKLLKRRIGLSKRTEELIARSHDKELELLTDSLFDIQTEDDVLNIIA